MTASVFTGPTVNAYVALTVARALDLYAKTGMKVNRAYTPKNMMATATKLTGQKFKARDYAGASKALRDYAQAIGEGISATTH